MSQNEHDAAIAEFLRRNGVTRCPTVCAVPTRASLTEADRLALRDHAAAREAARLEKSRSYRQLLSANPTGIAA
jgi:hypothetical protein